MITGNMALGDTTSVPILVFLCLSVLDLGLRTRQTDVRQHHRLMFPPRGGV